MNKLIILAIFLSACTIQGPPCTPSPTPTPSTTPITVTKKFPIGVWIQPYSSLSKWKVRGVNTLVGYELEGHTEAEFFAAAKNLGMDVLSNSSSSLGQTMAQMPDEFDCNTVDGKGQSKAQIQAAFDKLPSTLPKFCSFCGNHIAMSWAGDYTMFQSFCDVIGLDYYAVNLGQPISVIADAMIRLKSVAGNKPQWPFIETDDINGSGKAVTPDQFNQEIQLVLDNGAKGFIYFADTFNAQGGWTSFDATPPAIEAEMIKWSKKLNP